MPAQPELNSPEVTVRVLQARGANGAGEGATHIGTLLSIEGPRLQLRLPKALSTGTLVEVASDKRVYLGFVCRCQDGTLLVEAEHELDRADLKVIQGVWGRPGL